MQPAHQTVSPKHRRHQEAVKESHIHFAVPVHSQRSLKFTTVQKVERFLLIMSASGAVPG